MDKSKIIVGLDVGTTKICTIIAKKNQENDIELIGIGSHASSGIKKGSVINIDQTVQSIKKSIEDATLMAGIEIQHATIGIAGNHIFSFNNTGVVAIKNNEVAEEDINRAIEAAKAVIIPSDREILHVIPQEFKVDNTAGIKDPIGMCGVRLETKVHIVTGSVSLINNLVKCVNKAGLHADNIVLQPIASSRSVLDLDEKEMGTVLVDIGGGTTDLAIWKNGTLIHTQVIPIGGNHFTNDLAMALKISNAEAERIKLTHGGVLEETLNQSAHITIQGLSGTNPREIQLGIVARVLGARAEELFEVVKTIINENISSDKITGGIVLTGGGSLINGLSQLGEYLLAKPIKIGYPKPFGGMTNIMQNPKFSTVLGLLHWELDQEKNQRPTEDWEASHDILGKLGHSLKTVFKDIF